LYALEAGSVTNLLETMAEAHCPKAAEPLLQVLGRLLKKTPDEVSFYMENKVFNHVAP
jgi:hypothetical protein